MKTKFFLRYAYWRLRSLVSGRFYPTRDIASHVEFHGSDYGGWSIVANSLTADAIVYSVGIGMDVSFDLSLIQAYGCVVHGFDPTPKSKQWVAESVRESRFQFHPWALAAQSGEIELFFPKNVENVSGSVIRSAHLSELSVRVPAYSLIDIMQKLGHSRIDVLKMDIEGSEYAVLEGLLSGSVLSRVNQLLVEFHHFFDTIGDASTIKCIECLRGAGWGIAWYSATGREFLFIRCR